MSEHDKRAIIDVAETLAREAGGSVAVTLLRDRDDDQAYAAVIANPCGAASMLAAQCAAVLTYPRPTDCPACAAAFDRITMALGVLRPGPSARCN